MFEHLECWKTNKAIDEERRQAILCIIQNRLCSYKQYEPVHVQKVDII